MQNTHTGSDPQREAGWLRWRGRGVISLRYVPTGSPIDRRRPPLARVPKCQKARRPFGSIFSVSLVPADLVPLSVSLGFKLNIWLS